MTYPSDWSRLMRTGNQMVRLAFVPAVLALVFCVLAGPGLAADADIVITEIMQNPSAYPDAYAEWFEIHNTGETDVDLEGWTVMDDGSDSFVFSLCVSRLGFRFPRVFKNWEQVEGSISS